MKAISCLLVRKRIASPEATDSARPRDGLSAPRVGSGSTTRNVPSDWEGRSARMPATRLHLPYAPTSHPPCASTRKRLRSQEPIDGGAVVPPGVAEEDVALRGDEYPEVARATALPRLHEHAGGVGVEDGLAERVGQHGVHERPDEVGKLRVPAARAPRGASAPATAGRPVDWS
jgi:hypothetical protein